MPAGLPTTKATTIAIVCILYRDARVGDGKERHDCECDPGMEGDLETLDRRHCFAGRDACPMEVAACRRVTAAMVAGGWAITRSSIAWRRISLTHLRAGVIKPSITPTSVA